MNKKTIFGLCAAGLLFVSGMTLSGCGTSSGPGFLTQETPLSRSDFLLNTFVTITLYDSDDSYGSDDTCDSNDTHGSNGPDDPEKGQQQFRKQR